MKRYAWVVTAILALCTAAQGEISITPSEPTSQDEVQVTVSRWTNTGGYHIDDVTAQVVGNLIQLDLFWTTPSPGSIVTQAFVLHKRTLSLGQLSPGIYTVRVTHHGMRDGMESAFFTVSDSPAAGEDGTCDCICHRWPQMFAGRTCPFCGCAAQDAPDNGSDSLFDRLRNRMTLWPWW